MLEDGQRQWMSWQNWLAHNGVDDVRIEQQILSTNIRCCNWPWKGRASCWPGVT
jgi:LPS sulfotransferase NodH